MQSFLLVKMNMDILGITLHATLDELAIPVMDIGVPVTLTRSRWSFLVKSSVRTDTFMLTKSYICVFDIK